MTEDRDVGVGDFFTTSLDQNQIKTLDQNESIDQRKTNSHIHSTYTF